MSINTSGNSPRALALALCDGLLRDLERARSSARLNRGLNTVEVFMERLKAIGVAFVFGLVGLVMLNAYMPFWAAATLTLAGEGAIVALWIMSRRGRRRPAGPNLADASDEDRSALDATVSQLNTIVVALQAEGVDVSSIDFATGNLARLERAVHALRMVLQRV